MPAFGPARRRGRSLRAGLLGSAAAICLGSVAAAQELPSGASVAHGDVRIATPGAGTMTIAQGSNAAVVNWDSFSIGTGGHVDIRQPGADASILNRVTGAATSAIHGRLTANGRVHLVNPNGIFIGPDGTVDAGAFVASTLDIADGDFVAGRLSYRGSGRSATVENAGRVTIGRGGYAALLGGRVRNSGVVTVPMGRIAFGSGERAVLDLSGDQFLQVAVPTGGADGEEALIENSGLASAQGGLIEMRAATAREAVRQAVNLSGVAEARSVSVRNGAIVLGGGAGGVVNVTGRVSTRSEPSALILAESKRPPRAPEITVTGHRIRLAGAEIDASGAGGGGLVRIGGDFAGDGPLPRAETLSVDAATTIRADALGAGQGGRIALWSDRHTDFAGLVTARGGDMGGDGGFIEVSSKQRLRYAGLADTRAPLGSWGMLLLDPTDITIDPGEGGEDSLEASLGSTDVTLDTSPDPDDVGPGGDITINADLDWSAATTLFLVADNNVALNGSIAAPAGGLDIDATGTITAAGDIAVATFFLSDGSWEQFGTTASFSADDFSISQFASSFARTAGGDGSVGDPHQIFDIYGLQGIGTYGPLDSFVLVNDIDGSGTSGWTTFSGRGFDPVDRFTGTLDGDHFTVSDLFQDIETEGPGPVGMFNLIEGTVRDIVIADADFTGSDGGILSPDNDGTIENVRVSGTIRSLGGETGGVVGSNFAFIDDSIADVTIIADIATSATHSIGGFVGLNLNTINRSHATGSVTVTNTASGSNIAAGGFVGEENTSDTINDSYARGAVSVTSEVGSEPVIFAGGFVGFMNGIINRSYATGSVGITGDATAFEGGFAGQAGPEVGGTGDFWDTVTSGQSTSDFGSPLTTAALQDTAGFIATAGPFGWDFDTTWAPGEPGFYPVNYTTSSVVFAQPSDFSIQYGLTPGASTEGSVAGGPGLFVFDEDGDELDTSGVFTSLSFPEGETAGERPFLVDDGDLTSTDGVVYRVVDLPGVATITLAPLTILADDATKTYGEAFTPTDFTVSGTLFFDDTVDTVELSTDGGAADAPVDPGEGGYSIFAGPGITGTGLESYDISFVDGTLEVLRAPLTIIADDATKTYGEAFTPTDFTVSGTLFFDDSVDTVELSTDGGAADAPVDPGEGGYSIFAGPGITGTGLESYDISFVDGTLEVLRAPLTITPTDASKTFGETFVFTGTEFTATGFVVEGDSVDEVFLFSAGAPATASPGDYPILISGFEGTGLDSYDITEGTGTLRVLAGTDVRPPPPVVIKPVLPNPPDGFEGEVFGGETGIIGGSALERQRAAETLAKVQDISTALEIAADACGESGGDVSRYLACLSDALGDFAGELDAISLDLPPGLENVAQIIQTARRQIDGAATRAAARLATATTEAERQAIRRDAANEARAALATASNEIRKAITLVRVEDPGLASLQRATITTVANAVDTVAIELTRVTDL